MEIMCYNDYAVLKKAGGFESYNAVCACRGIGSNDFLCLSVFAERSYTSVTAITKVKE